jgi:mRNA degradation ribonuclease J1/J2
MTIVEGDTGITIYDPLTSAEAARYALDLYYRHRPRRPVVAVVHSHSHVDHVGGVRGVVDEADVKAVRRADRHAPLADLGHAEITKLIKAQRDTYQFIHDRSCLCSPWAQSAVKFRPRSGTSESRCEIAPWTRRHHEGAAATFSSNPILRSNCTMTFLPSLSRRPTPS